MISASDLNEEQKARIATLAEEGATLGDIQKRLAEEYQLSMTYLDARLLIGDLGVKLVEDEPPEKSEEPEEPEDPTEPEPAPGEEEAGADALADGLDTVASGEEAAPGGGAVTLSMSEVTPPGMFASGKATFSDGEQAEWYVDEMGRLGLNPDTEGYRPSEPDVQAFQAELQKLAESEGL